MLLHHLQKEILHRLVVVDCARFAELRPDGIDGNLFTYHLQQLIKQNYVAKLEDGSYCLTANGKAAGITVTLTEQEFLIQAHSVLLLAVRDERGRWLLRKRKAHPMFGRAGFIHGEPRADEPTAVTASNVLQRKTGLAAEFTALGDGYIRIMQAGDLESFTHFTILTASVDRDIIIKSDQTGENFWHTGNSFDSDTFIPSMPTLASYTAAGKPFFAELEYNI